MAEAAGTQAVLDPVTYLDRVRATETGRRAVDRSLEHLALGSGHRVLDIGCGTGDEVLRAAERVGPGGVFAGLDLNRAMVLEARARAGRRWVPEALCRRPPQLFMS